MRRHHISERRPPHRARRWLAMLFALSAALLMLYWCIEERFEPILDELAEYEARAAVSRAVDAAVAAELAAHPQRYARVYTVQYSGATPLAVQADAALLNDACLTLTEAVNQALTDLPPVQMTVPFGTLTDLSLLNALGPGWPLGFVPEAFAAGTVRESAGTVAINATRYAASVELIVTVNTVLDGKNRVLYVTQSVPLASVIVGGDTPLYYAAGG